MNVIVTTTQADLQATEIAEALENYLAVTVDRVAVMSEQTGHVQDEWVKPS